MLENVTFAAAVTAILQGIGVGGGLYMVRWLMLFFAGRKDHQEARNDAATQLLIVQLQGQVGSLLDRCTLIETALEHCRDEHAECRKEVMELRGLIQGRGDARNESAAIVARDRVADKRKPQGGEK